MQTPALPPPQPGQENQQRQRMVVTVPSGVAAGQPFQVMANGQPHMLTCPAGVSAGQQVQFMVPVPAGCVRVVTRVLFLIMS
jgi:hypothetical protein